jgi:polar amino acid transport system substrate-binding protein
VFDGRLFIAALLAAVPVADARQEPDPRVADLVRVGKVRIALFPPQYMKDPATGELKGVWADVARAFAARVGVELVWVERRTPPEMLECLKSGAADGDRPGARIAVVRAHASTLTLSRIRKGADLVTVDTPDEPFDLLRSGRVEAWASAPPALVEYSARLPGSRVLEDRYGVNRPALVVAKGQAARLAYISEFIEQIKASGFVQEAIRRSGWRGLQVAPPASPHSRK